MYPVQQQRPAGVSVLAILSVIAGVFGILGGLAVAVVFGAFLGFDPTGLTGLFITVCSGIFIVSGLIEFLLAWGLWNMQGWAWTLSVIFAIIGLILFPIGTIISIIILLYLFKPEIKAVFGKGAPSVYPPPYAYPPYGPPGGPPYAPPQQPWQPSTAPSAPPPAPPASPTPPTAGGKTCWNCGTPLQAGQKFCSACGAKVE